MRQEEHDAHVNALRTLLAHTRETYPHFESPRGQTDIQAADKAIAALSSSYRETSYNGWRNYETWCANLWLTNDSGEYEHCMDLARECSTLDMAEECPPLADYYAKPENVAAGRRHALAERLKAEIEEGAEDAMEQGGVSATFLSDMLHAALSEVNWDDIAEHFMDALEESTTNP